MTPEQTFTKRMLADIRSRRGLLLKTAAVVLAIGVLGTLVLLTLGGSFDLNKNILVLGVDRKPGDTGRSDTIMLVRINCLSRKTKILSVPRDTKAHIPGKGTGKINAAFAYGGSDLARETVSGFLAIPIHAHAVVDFDAFVRSVDALGGVTVDVDKHMRYDDPFQDLHIDIEPGLQRLDGRQALNYARFRNDAEGDVARMRRQQSLMVALIKKAASPLAWGRLPFVIKAVGETVTTDLSLWNLPVLAMGAARGALLGIETRTLAGRAAMQNGASYWLTEQAELDSMLQEFWGIKR